MTSKSFSTAAVVLKRVNVGEVDRVVTLLTPEFGKLVCVAKGVRKLHSTQRAALEPGNHVVAYLIRTQSMPLLTQTKLINEFTDAKRDLKRLKHLLEVLEMIDCLFPEGVEEQLLFDQILEILEQLDLPVTPFQSIQRQLSDMLVQLGYQDWRDTPYTSIGEYVTHVAERPIKSYDYLTVRK